MLDQQEMALEQSSFSHVPPMEEYDPNVQFCKTTIVNDIILYTWGSLDSADRQYLLKKWADECLSTPINGMSTMKKFERLGKCSLF